MASICSAVMHNEIPEEARKAYRHAHAHMHAF